MDVLITGGAGYIGSTVASALADAGHRPVLLDDLSTGRAEFLRGYTSYVGDVADRGLVRRVLVENPGITVVVHCAARVVVPESVTDPAAYYGTNVVGSLRLAEALLEHGVTDLVFSGSASIYEPGGDLAVDEGSAWGPRSPYARTKAAAEWLLRDLAAAGPLRVVALRYFNPIGADPRLRSGTPGAVPAHVLGRLLRAQRTGEPFAITGVDYPTRDGTGVRDYVHVWDLARAHVAAVEGFDGALDGERYSAVNLGTGRGTTVRELVAAFEQVTGAAVPVVEAARRPGDTPGAWARTGKAARVLGWAAGLDLRTAIGHTLAWAEREAPARPALAAVGE